MDETNLNNNGKESSSFDNVYVDDQTVSEAMQKFEWERQYFHSHNEPQHANAIPLILIGGLLIMPFIAWMLTLVLLPK